MLEVADKLGSFDDDTADSAMTARRALWGPADRARKQDLPLVVQGTRHKSVLGINSPVEEGQVVAEGSAVDKSGP